MLSRRISAYQKREIASPKSPEPFRFVIDTRLVTSSGQLVPNNTRFNAPVLAGPRSQGFPGNSNPSVIQWPEKSAVLGANTINTLPGGAFADTFDTEYTEFLINWGDGSPVEVHKLTAGEFPTVSIFAPHHEYASPGIYEISIAPTKRCANEELDSEGRRGQFGIHAAQCNNWRACITDIISWGKDLNCRTWSFNGCTNLQGPSATDFPEFPDSRFQINYGSRAFDAPAELVTVEGCQIHHMFPICHQLTGNDSWQAWDTQHITDMSHMFAMDLQFPQSQFNAPIQSWNVSKVRNFWEMFDNCSNFTQDLSTWNTSGATNMRQMFNGCAKFNSNIGSWDTSNVNRSPFPYTDNIGGTTGLEGAESVTITHTTSQNIRAETGMQRMFRACTGFNQDLSSWCVENIQDEPFEFDLGTLAWTLPRPNFGAPC